MVRTPGFHPGNRVSTTRRSTKSWRSSMVEQGPFKPLVVGSSPSGGTIIKNKS